jgi:hypothetical protein
MLKDLQGGGHALFQGSVPSLRETEENPEQLRIASIRAEIQNSSLEGHQ